MPGSSYETLTLRVLKVLFPTIQWQERARPNWLRNPVTGNPLELDLYDPVHSLAIEVQGGQHYRSVAGLADAEHSQKQQDRDTFKRHRCAELGIRLWIVSIFDLTLERLYQLYLDMHQHMPVKDFPMTRMQFTGIPEVQSVVAEADKLSRRKLRPYRATKKSTPGIWRTITHLLGGS